MTGNLVFAAHGVWFWIGCVLLILLVSLSFHHNTRQGWNRRILRLETLRILAGILVLITLAKPEWWQALEPTSKPVVKVLTDASGSMDTPDMPDQESRRVWLERQRSNPVWNAIAERFQIQWQSFESVRSEQTDLHKALSEASANTSALAAVVLFSDGDSNVGDDPMEAISSMKTSGIPLHAVPVGDTQALPDLAIGLLPIPKSAAIDEPMHIPFRLTNRFDVPHAMVVTFTIGDAVIDTRTITVGPGSSRRDRFVWKPDSEGAQSVRLSIPEIDEEVRRDNNQDNASLTIRRDQINVLLVDSVPRWEFRYLRNALLRDPGVKVATVLFHPEGIGMGQGPGYLEDFPASPQALSRFDVVFLGDVGLSEGQLRPEDTEHLKGLIEHQSSGLVFVPGSRGHYLSLANSALGPLIPVALDDTQRKGIGSAAPSELDLTEAGRENVLT